MELKRYKVFVDCEEDYVSGRKRYSIETIEGLADNQISASESDPTDTFFISKEVLRLLFGTTHNGNELHWHYEKYSSPFRNVGVGEVKRTFYSSLGVYTVHLLPVNQFTTGYIAGIDSNKISMAEYHAIVGKGFPVKSKTPRGYKAAIITHMKKHLLDQDIRFAGIAEYASDKTFLAGSMRIGTNGNATLMAIFTDQIFVEYEEGIL